ncbi:glycosyltransferase [Nocardioides marmoribigeumensis]|uniref:Galactofuranosylgalactofuranosylrhamnosyl-N-acetylglucosaminyl-diphospho-decaprenol beta-1,5/1,6-galactofuranosyltransferase n=1 Tax=Nocardioides marmoribigeumensis TaxID=433649 RepID=A0ABU2C027_9ACTN|nr:glycosyltransferase [Nocardioides marmoribigeumensis]MDR7364005.1 galactofuranosylgalactofuranosylrhamnosyl-N-acetylglucosaminyl-diphospho-decaprenol beta-1,5/1,6-galactofuranosyltransferase [Nocardioides marmoribigeumensis]
MTLTSTTAQTTGADQGPTVERLLQRQILPLDRDLDVLSLYVDPAEAALDVDRYEIGSNRSAQEAHAASLRQKVGAGADVHPDQILDRTRMRVPQGERLSFGTYFNAFPASYWRRWTVVSEVRLTVRLTGPGATVIVYKSMANGRSQRVDSATTRSVETEAFTFDLTLKPFVDGGWYWYNVVAGDDDVVVESAEWTGLVPEDRASHGTTTVGITTMNRPDFCAKLLGQIADDADLRPYLDEVLVVDQGNQKVTGSEYFPAAQEALGGTLRVIEQGNLGGSGGYARGQLETVRRGTATYFLCMDDDVVCEPEGIIRAVTFADLARRRTIVGGHMFSLYSRSRLHSFGEIVQPWRFWWQSAPGVFNDWDFSARNLRSARWLHKRIDVDFNGWFMCLIPTSVLAEIGLSLPLFIKWDDSEFGLRAKAIGVPTVTFPGAAVWHVPWTDKNDALDWQAFYHQRNRFIAALLHSPYERGGRMVRESLNHQIKHLVSMQYSTVELRHQALEEILAGPDHLHADLPTRLGRIKQFVQDFTDARLQADPDAFPPVRREKPPRKGRDGTEIPGRLSQLVTAGLAPIRQLKAPRRLSRTNPEAEVPAMDAKWYRLARFDSAIVSMPDGTSAALYQRDPERYRELVRKTLEIHQRLHREWPRLARLYRDHLDQVVSPEAWDRTFGTSPADMPAGRRDGDL